MTWQRSTLIGWARRAISALVLPALALTGCSGSVEPGVTVIATVAGQPITQAVLNAYVMQRAGLSESDVDPDQKAALLDDLLKLAAAASMARQPAPPLADPRAELAGLEAAAKTAAKAAGVYRMPSDDELQAEYERFLAAQPALDYHAAHILVPTEAQARTTVQRLNAGVEFATLATTMSADQSRDAGGDLGWLKITGLPPEFTDEVKNLSVGAYTSTPIKTKYGWHVIRLIETRPAAPIPLQAVRSDLIVSIQRGRYQQFLDAALSHVEVVRT